jgi:hypothetical protein
MTETEESVLVRELGKLAGFFGGFGARFAARRLPVEESEAAIAVAAGSTDLRISLVGILRGIGTISDEFAAETPMDSISAIVGSGHMNLNPTIVHVRIVASSDVTTQLFLRAVAKEGLIKQQSAQRAIERITTLVLKQYAEQHVGPERR